MALFGKKKGADAAPDALEAQPSNISPGAGAFDFDSIARDLEAPNGGASSFDDLLSQPATAQNGAMPNDAITPDNEEAPDNGSAFDFPEDNSDPLGFPNQSPPASRPIPINVEQVAPETDPFGLLADGTPVLGVSPNQPQAAAPVVSPNSGLAGDEPYEPYQPVAKKSPLVPILAGLVALALVGAGTFSFFKSQNAGEEVMDTQTPITSMRPAEPGVSIPARPVPTTTMRTTMADPVAVANSIKSANPGIGANSGPVTPPKIVTAATVPLTPAMKVQLKKLWDLGAAAKKRRDYASARAVWTQALQLRPNHPGFQESIDKLPR